LDDDRLTGALPQPLGNHDAERFRGTRPEPALAVCLLDHGHHLAARIPAPALPLYAKVEMPCLHHDSRAQSLPSGRGAAQHGRSHRHLDMHDARAP
jgi:hypothetical protein